jgi:hypothetical protein
MESIVSSTAKMKHGGGDLRRVFDTDVEPDRRIEGRPLRDHEVLELVAERARLGRVDEVAISFAPGRDGVDDAVDDLLERPFTSR